MRVFIMSVAEKINKEIIQPKKMGLLVGASL